MTTRQERKAEARAEREARERAAARAAQQRKRLVQLGSVVGVALIVVLALVLVSQKGKSNTGGGGAIAGAADTRAMLRGLAQHGTSLGDPKAPLVLTEFADLQCPFCRAYTLDVLPQIIQRYVRTGKLRLDLRLQRFIGAESDVAARAAQAAATRDRMWNFVDLFYRNQGRENSGYVTDSFLSGVATAAGLPAKLVVDGSTSPALEKPLLDAEAQARAAGLTATPSFLIGPTAGRGKALNVTRLDIGAFATAIDPEVAR